MSLRSGEQPCGSGVKWLVRTFSRSKFLRSRGHSDWMGEEKEGHHLAMWHCVQENEGFCM